MNKQELLHLHQLAQELHNHLDSSTVPEEYAELDISPSEVYRSNTDHKQAMKLLMESTAETVEETPLVSTA